jgi:hypothetical protein
MKKNNEKIKKEKAEDFIIIAEYCEKEGAIETKIIGNPSNKLNIQDFVKRVLVSDSNIDSMVQGKEWQIIPDQQTFLKQKDFYAYVHYITLRDIYARGYSRPFCISYITQSKTKIMSNFESFLYSFNIVSRILKFGNNYVLLKDLQKCIEKLNIEVENDENYLERNLPGIKKDMITPLLKSIEQFQIKFEMYFDKINEENENFFKNLYFYKNTASFKEENMEYLKLMEYGLEASPDLLQEHLVIIYLKNSQQLLNFFIKQQWD